MRYWSILLEVSIAILILITFYIVFLINNRMYSTVYINDVEDFRKAFYGCSILKDNKFILDYLNGTVIYCNKGESVNMLNSRKIIYTYLFSGNETAYSPFIIIMVE